MSEQHGRGDVGRCPACGARVVADQDWCGLCHEPLAPGPATTMPDDAPAETPADTPAATPAESPAEPPAETPADPLPHPLADRPSSVPPGVAEAMLAELARTSAASRPLGRTRLSGTSRTARMALAVAAAVVLTGVIAALLGLVALLL